MPTCCSPSIRRTTAAGTGSGGLVDAGRQVAVADVADANGADPALVHALAAAGVSDRLAGYAGWNTAGNSIGSAISQAVARQHASTPDRLAAHRRLLAHRFLEDWGYQTDVRQRAGSGPELARLLAGRLAELVPFGAEYRLDPDSVRLPWQRPFEVDFRLIDQEAVDG